MSGRARWSAVVVLSAAVAAVSACGNKSSNPNAASPSTTTTPPVPSTAGPTVQSLLIEGSCTLTVGQTAQLDAEALYVDGTQQAVTSAVQWTSSDPAKFTVSNSGLVTAVAAGEAKVVASVAGVSTAMVVDINPPTPDPTTPSGPATSPRVIAIAITGTLAIQGGQTSQLKATATISDGSHQDVTALASWSSDASSIASVAATGLVTAGAVGTARVAADYQGVSGQVQVQITGHPITVNALAVSGAASLIIGDSTSFSAIATLSDGSQQNVTSSATWSSTNTGVGTVTGAGLVTGVTAGSTAIVARYLGVQQQASVQVNASAGGVVPTIVDLAIAGLLTCTVGNSVQLTATEALSDGSHQLVTPQAIWQSLLPAVASVNGSGAVNCLTAGASTIQAQFGGLTRTVIVVVTGLGLPTPVSLVINGGLSLLVGATTPLTAIEHLSDGSTVDVTSLATWTSDNPLFATVSAGLVRGIGIGLCPIHAAYQGLTAQSSVSIGAAPVTLVSLSTTADITVQLLKTIQLTVIAHYSDGSTQDVSSQVSWSSDLPALLSILGGVLKALIVGVCHLTGTYQGLTTTVTVHITL